MVNECVFIKDSSTNERLVFLNGQRNCHPFVAKNAGFLPEGLRSGEKASRFLALFLDLRPLARQISLWLTFFKRRISPKTRRGPWPTGCDRRLSPRWRGRS